MGRSREFLFHLENIRWWLLDDHESGETSILPFCPNMRPEDGAGDLMTKVVSPVSKIRGYHIAVRGDAECYIGIISILMIYYHCLLTFKGHVKPIIFSEVACWFTEQRDCFLVLVAVEHEPVLGSDLCH